MTALPSVGRIFIYSPFQYTVSAKVHLLRRLIAQSLLLNSKCKRVRVCVSSFFVTSVRAQSDILPE